MTDDAKKFVRAPANFTGYLINQELKVTSSIRSDHSSNRQVQTKRWFDGKDHGQFLMNYDIDFDTRRSLCSGRMDDVCIDYLSERNAREMQQKESRWQQVLSINNSPSSTTRLLCEQLFKLERSRYISRPNFISCIRTVSGLDTISRAHLSAMTNAFDPLDKGRIDWRALVFMLDVASHPSQACRTVLSCAFRCFGGDAIMGGLLDAPCNDTIRLRDLKLILDPILRADTSDVLEQFDEAWFSVVTSNEAGAGLGTELERAESATISPNLFELMLDSNSIAKLLEPSIQVGRGPLSVCVCEFEQRYYPTTLLEHVIKARRGLNIANLLYNLDMERKRHAVSEWRCFVSSRKSARKTFDSILLRLESQLLSQSLVRLRRYAMRQVAAVEVQRVFRGFLGRVDARISLIYERSATRLQALFRGWFKRVQYASLCLKRELAAIELQRLTRGRQGRHLALKKLLLQVEEEQRQLDVARRKWDLARKESSAIVIQRLYRGGKSREREWARLQRELEAKRQIEAKRDVFRRERKIFEGELEEFYRQKKAEREELIASQIRADKEKVRCRTLRRRIKNESLDAAFEAKMLHDEEKEKVEASEFVDKWQHTAESRGEARQELCLRCLQAPSTPDERKLASKLKKKIKARTSDVIQRADVRKIEMEWPEAAAIAQKEVLHLEGEEERAKVQEEMKRDSILRKDLRKRRMEEKIRLANEQKTLDQHRAAILLTMACRRWRARRTLREKCFEAFEKVFDESHHAFYYKNRRTGELSWEKPKALGLHDLPTKDAWVVLRDAQDFPYYYNPSSMDMSWKPPKGHNTMCQESVRQTWRSEYPVPIGPCEYFATSARHADGKFFCERCTAARSGQR